MAHETTGMTIVKNPADGFSHSITGVENTRDVTEKDVTGRFPILNSEVADVNVARAFGRDAIIDHLDAGFIIFIENRGYFLRESKLSKYRA